MVPIPPLEAKTQWMTMLSPSHTIKVLSFKVSSVFQHMQIAQDLFHKALCLDPHLNHHVCT